MLATIIIPSYKGKDLLKYYSLYSLAYQSYKNLEIIIVNDGEDNSTRDYIESLKDSRIKYYEIERFENKNSYQTWALSGTRSRNFGLKKVTGDIIIPLDQDDMLCPDFVEKRIKKHRENSSIDFIYSKSANVGNDSIHSVIGADINLNNRKKEYILRNKSNYIPHCAVSYKKEHRNLAYPVEGNLAGDYTLWCSFVDMGAEFFFMDEIQSIRNGKNNTKEYLHSLYKDKFKV